VVNVISGLAFVVFAGVFWVQRNYTSEFGGLFADPVIIVMAVLGLVLALLGLVQRGPSEHKSDVPLAGVIRAVLLLVAWVALLPTLGYVVDGLVFFVLAALLMRDHRPSLKGLALDVGVSVGVVAVLYLVFTWVLVVQLPEFAL
jgi:hypothetical protein